MRGVVVVALAAALFAGITCPAYAQSQEPGAIIVTVTDAVTGKPIDNAQVFILGGDEPLSSLTNARGLLDFEGIQPGTYRVQIEADGYEKTNAAAEVLDGQRVRVAAALLPVAPLKTIASVIAKASVVTVTIEQVNEESAQRKVSQSLADALNKLAGVNIDNTLYNGDSAFNISLRGADPSLTAYSVDGVRINGAASQLLGGAQDLFSGASVNFAPGAGGDAGNVNFNTVAPTKTWNYNFTGDTGNYSKTLGMWYATGGWGKFAFAFEHTAGGQDGPLNGKVYEDQTGSAYSHEGGFSRSANLLKTSITLSPVSTLKYSFISSLFNQSQICADATALLPCGTGPNSYAHSNGFFQTLAFGTLLGHVQLTLNGTTGQYKSNASEPNRAVNGIVVPYFSSSIFPFSNVGLRVNWTARRHTVDAGYFEYGSSGLTTSSFNGTRTVQSSIFSHFSYAYAGDTIKLNGKLTLSHNVAISAATGAGSSFELYEALTWTPNVNDVLQGGVGFGGTNGSANFTTALGDALTAQYDCFNRSVFVDGPTDQATRQSSANYSLDWRHTLKAGYIKFNAYRSQFGGGGLRAAVPINAEPSSIFPNGSLVAYLAQLQQTWSQPTVCGSTPFDPSGVYVSQFISGPVQVNQGFSISGQIPITKTLDLFPTYAVTNSYYSVLDPRLLAPGSYYSIGAQIPRVPLHKAGLIIDGAVPRANLEWLFDTEFTSANNPQNLPAYTIYNAGLVFKLPRGSLTLFGANLFGTHTGLFSTYQGVNPMPLQGGGNFAFSTTPLAPRTFTLQYQIRWQQPKKPAPAPQTSASPKP